MVSQVVALLQIRVIVIGRKNWQPKLWQFLVDMKIIQFLLQLIRHSHQKNSLHLSHMNEEQHRIAEYLSANAVGYPNRKTSTEIRNNCFLESGGPTNEHIRDLIRDMILDHGFCIGSTNYGNGYWIILNEEELNLSTDNLQKRANGVIRRKDALRTNWENKQNG